MELAKEKRRKVFVPFILSQWNFFLRFVFYYNIQYIEYTFRIYILLHIKKEYFIHFCCFRRKSSVCPYEQIEVIHSFCCFPGYWISFMTFIFLSNIFLIMFLYLIFCSVPFLICSQLKIPCFVRWIQFHTSNSHQYF